MRDQDSRPRAAFVSIQWRSTFPSSSSSSIVVMLPSQGVVVAGDIGRVLVRGVTTGRGALRLDDCGLPAVALQPPFEVLPELRFLRRRRDVWRDGREDGLR